MISRTYHDFAYRDMVYEILMNGIEKENRTGTNALSIFSYQMRFDLSDGTIPLLTTKKMHTKSIIHELLWFLTGDTNIKYLNDNGVTIWDEWADENGDLGPVYGKQWRAWTDYYTGIIGQEWAYNEPTIGIDQLGGVIHKIRNNPNDRRLLVSAWNVNELKDMALPPCHYSFQFWVGDGRLSMMMNQRSCDVGLGVPFNIAQYSILLHMVAQVTALHPGEFIWNGGDVHIYVDHIDALREQVNRSSYESPKLQLNKDVGHIDGFKYDDFKIVNYECHPTVKMQVSV